jgi:hypothetical protein
MGTGVSKWRPFQELKLKGCLMRQNKARLRLLAVFAISIFPMLVSAGFAQVTVPEWSGSFTDTYRTDWPPFPFTMVGGNPASTETTTVNVYVIPLEVVFPNTSCQSGQSVFDPETVINGNGTVVIQSPIFTPILNFPEAPSGAAITWIDAFQRGNFWSSVNVNPGYHTVLNILTPYVAEQVITLSDLSNGAANDDPLRTFGGCIGVVDPVWFGGQIVALIDALYT